MRPIDLFWLLLPEKAFPLLIVGLGMATIVGIMRPRRAISILLMLALVPVVSILVEAIVSRLPWWVGVTLLVVLALNVIRVVLEILLGRVAAGHVLGAAVVGTFRTLLAIGAGVIRLLVLGMRQISSRLARRRQQDDLGSRATAGSDGAQEAPAASGQQVQSAWVE